MTGREGSQPERVYKRAVRDSDVALPLPFLVHERYDATRPVALSQRRKQRVASSRSLNWS